jgi:hypothetical protein
MASTKFLNADSYKKELETKLSEYKVVLKAYKQSRSEIAVLSKDASANLVFIPNKTIQTDGRPVMGSKQSTKELCKSTITGDYKAALYNKNQFCGLFTSDKPSVVDSTDASDFVIINEKLYSAKIKFDKLNEQLTSKCDDIIKTLKSPEYAKVYGDSMKNNSGVLSDLTRMSKQLEADRNEIDKQSGLTSMQEMDQLEETQKMTKLTADSNYYISSLFVFVLVIIVIGGIYLMVPSSTNGAVQTGGGKLSKQSYFMIAILLLVSIIIFQLRSNRH